MKYLIYLLISSVTIHNIEGLSTYSNIKKTIFGNYKSSPSRSESESSPSPSPSSIFKNPLQSLTNSWMQTKKQIINIYTTYELYIEVLYYLTIFCLIKYCLPASLQQLSYLSMIYIYIFGHSRYIELLTNILYYRKTSFIVIILYNCRFLIIPFVYSLCIYTCIKRISILTHIYVWYLKQIPYQSLSIYNKEFLSAFQSNKKKLD